MSRAVAVSLTLLVAGDARADERWPVLHDVLGKQRELPCEETWKAGSEVTTYAMRFDRAGHLVERVESGGDARSRYRYAAGKIVRIDTDDPAAGEKLVTTIRYGGQGLASLTTLTTRKLVAIGAETKHEQSAFKLVWKRGPADTVRIIATLDGKVGGEDVAHYHDGRLSSIDLGIGDVMSAAYDADGRLTSMTTSYDGKATGVTRYTYDDKGRLVRQEFDQNVDGVVDQAHEYSYRCGK